MVAHAMMLIALANLLRWLPHATPGDGHGERAVAGVARDAGLHFSACVIRLSASSGRSVRGQPGRCVLVVAEAGGEFWTRTVYC